MSSGKHLVHQETKVLDEVIGILVKPDKYGVPKEELFEYLNKFTEPDQDESDPLEKDRQVSTKMVDFQKFLELGRVLASEDLIPSEKLLQTLSTNVYINHLQTTTEFAAPQSFEAPSISPYYMPDLRLPIKNVLLLFINYFKKQETKIAAGGGEGLDTMHNLMLLLNVSIVNKLVNIFRAINPRCKLKYESLMMSI